MLAAQRAFTAPCEPIRPDVCCTASGQRHGGIDAADLAIAATAQLLGAPLLTRDVRRLPMSEGLTAPSGGVVHDDGDHHVRR